MRKWSFGWEQAAHWVRCGLVSWWAREQRVSWTGSRWCACSSSRWPSRSASVPSPGCSSASSTRSSTAVWAGPWPRRSATPALSSASRPSSTWRPPPDSTALSGSTPSFPSSDSSSSCYSCPRLAGADSMRWRPSPLLLFLHPTKPTLKTLFHC